VSFWFCLFWHYLYWISLFCFPMCISNLVLKILGNVNTCLVKTHNLVSNFFNHLQIWILKSGWYQISYGITRYALIRRSPRKLKLVHPAVASPTKSKTKGTLVASFIKKRQFHRSSNFCRWFVPMIVWMSSMELEFMACLVAHKDFYLLGWAEFCLFGCPRNLKHPKS
jgi:hypothetical protein